jgi:hypothetical protein
MPYFNKRCLRARRMAVTLAFAISLAGCAAPMTDTGRTTATGAGVGAVTGAVVGSLSGNAGWGAVAGAGLGAAGGYVAGRSREARRDTYWRGHRDGRNL